MQESSLVKWVDELQGQIDALKRDIASIPAPEPPAPSVLVETLDVELVPNGSDVTCVVDSELMDDTLYDTVLTLHGVVGATTADDYYLIDISNRHVGDTAARNFPVYYYDADGAINIPAIVSVTENYQPNGGVVSITSFALLGSGSGTAVATLIATPKTTDADSRTKKKTKKK